MDLAIALLNPLIVSVRSTPTGIAVLGIGALFAGEVGCCEGAARPGGAACDGGCGTALVTTGALLVVLRDSK